MRRLLLTSASLLLLVGLTNCAIAQQTGTGTTTTGTTTTGTTTTGTTQTGGTGATQPFGNQVQLQATGEGGQALQLGGSNVTQEFVGASNTAEFVGAGAADAATQQFFRQFSTFTQEDVTTATTREQTGTPRQIPFALRVAFAVPQIDHFSDTGPLRPLQIVRIRTIRPELADVQIAVVEQTAVITGSVDSVDARRLAENLMRLEPGVRKIDNQLLVRQP